MKYNRVEVDWISQWILSYVKDSDTLEPTSSIVAALTVHVGISESQVRRRLRKLREVGLLENDPEPNENVADTNLYKTNPDAISELDGLSSPPSFQNVGEIEQKLVEEREERRRLESEVRELRSELELLQSHFNARGHERIARIEVIQQDYLMKHAKVKKQRWDALERLLEDHNVTFENYFKNHPECHQHRS